MLIISKWKQWLYLTKITYIHLFHFRPPVNLRPATHCAIFGRSRRRAAIVTLCRETGSRMAAVTVTESLRLKFWQCPKMWGDHLAAWQPRGPTSFVPALWRQFAHTAGCNSVCVFIMPSVGSKLCAVPQFITSTSHSVACCGVIGLLKLHSV